MSSRNQTEIAKETKKTILYNLCDTIDQAKHDNDGRVPFGFVAGLVRSHVAVCPWLSRDALNNEMRRRKKRSRLLVGTQANQITTSVRGLQVAMADRKKGGRPFGTTDDRRKNNELAVVASKNEICLQYDDDKKKLSQNICQKGILLVSYRE